MGIFEANAGLLVVVILLVGAIGGALEQMVVLWLADRMRGPYKPVSKYEHRV